MRNLEEDDRGRNENYRPGRHGKPWIGSNGNPWSQAYVPLRHEEDHVT